MIKASALSLCSVEEQKTNSSLSIFRSNNQNIIIGASDSKDEIPNGVENLAYRLMVHDSVIKEYILGLRDNFKNKKEDFHFSLVDKNEEERKVIIDLFQALYGIVTVLHYCPECKMLNGKVALSSKAQTFILGQYMEIALFKQTKDIMEALSRKYNKKFEVYKNVKVSSKEGLCKNEFDLVIESYDGLVWVIEIKSGSCFRDFYKYTLIGRAYGIVPNRFLLVDNYLSEEQCETTQYFCDYLVCNLENGSFSKKLIEMIDEDMKGDF